MKMDNPICCARAGPLDRVAEGAGGLIAANEAVRCVPIDTII